MSAIVDLTMPIWEGMPVHPAHGRSPVFLDGTLRHDLAFPPLQRRNPYDGSQISWANRLVVICDHTGTHIDAPLHADPAGQPIDRLALEHALGPAIWLDLSAHRGDGAELDAGDLERAERAGGEPIRPGDIVLIHTGWSTVLPDTERYLTRHMGLTRSAAEWLRAREIRTLGIDTCTPETVSGARESPVHMNFLRPRSLTGPHRHVIAIIENLVAIDSIPSRRFEFIGAPLPLRGLTGSPIRALARVG